MLFCPSKTFCPAEQIRWLHPRDSTTFSLEPREPKKTEEKMDDSELDQVRVHD